MKNIIMLIALSFGASCAFGQTTEVAPKVVNYQGKLTDAAGLPFGGEQGGTFKLRFKIYPVPTEGDAVWAEERDVVVIGGIFNVALGGAGGVAVNEIPMDLGAAFSAPERFLETTVVSGPEGSINQTLAPRQQLASVPYALVSQTANHSTLSERATVAALAESLIPHLSQALNPPGTIITYAGAVGNDSGGLIEPIPGYFLCNGAVIDGTAFDGKFAALSASLGNTWGNGGNAGNAQVVNLPDLRGVFLRGWNGTATDGYADPDRNGRGARKSGGNTGNNVGTFQMDELKSHDHSLPYRQVPRPGGGSEPTPYPGSGHRTGHTGGSETRSKNAYVVYLIKY